jgi:hypothetical protein
MIKRSLVFSGLVFFFSRFFKVQRGFLLWRVLCVCLFFLSFFAFFYSFLFFFFSFLEEKGVLFKVSCLNTLLRFLLPLHIYEPA